jgi:hypothetical protein
MRWPPAAAAVRRIRQSWSSALQARPGVFGQPGLHSPSDWSRIAAAHLTRCETTADAIRASSSTPSVRTLQLFDDLSNEICSVLDVWVLRKHVVVPSFDLARLSTSNRYHS